MNYLIISNSCVGYKIDLKLNGNKYLTPFVGSLIPNDLEYIKLCNNIEKYINIEPICNYNPKDNTLFSIQTNNKYYNHLSIKVPYPIHLDDIEIHFIHENLTCEDMCIKFNRRKERMINYLKLPNSIIVNTLIFSELFNIHDNIQNIINLFCYNDKYLNIFVGPEKYFNESYKHYIKIMEWNELSLDRDSSNVIKWNNQPYNINILSNYIISIIK